MSAELFPFYFRDLYISMQFAYAADLCSTVQHGSFTTEVMQPPTRASCPFLDTIFPAIAEHFMWWNSLIVSGQEHLYGVVWEDQGYFCDGTRRYGVQAPFFQSKETFLFVMYIINEYVISG